MADKAHYQTDQILEQMERHLSAIYSRAGKELQAKIGGYMRPLQKEADEILSRYNAADFKERQAIKTEYQLYWQKITRSPEFKALAAEIARSIYETNTEANQYINHQTAGIYQENYNAIGNSLRKRLPYRFRPVTAEEVEKYGDLTMQKVDRRKDEAWNRHNAISAIILGAFAMMPAKKISGLAAQKVATKNLNGSKLHARGMVTDAENKGRLDSITRANDYSKTVNGKYSAENTGFHLMKKWNAVKDNRTRHAHQRLDGKVVELDEDFEPHLSQPRDPRGSPDQIDNCRCWLTYVLPDSQESKSMAVRKGYVKGSVQIFESFAGTRTINTQVMTYEEWIRWKHGNNRKL